MLSIFRTTTNILDPADMFKSKIDYRVCIFFRHQWEPSETLLHFKLQSYGMGFLFGVAMTSVSTRGHCEPSFHVQVINKCDQLVFSQFGLVWKNQNQIFFLKT